MSETTARVGARPESRRRIWAAAVTVLVLAVSVIAGLLDLHGACWNPFPLSPRCTPRRLQPGTPNTSPTGCPGTSDEVSDRPGKPGNSGGDTDAAVIRRSRMAARC